MNDFHSGDKAFIKNLYQIKGSNVMLIVIRTVLT